MPMNKVTIGCIVALVVIILAAVIIAAVMSSKKKRIQHQTKVQSCNATSDCTAPNVCTQGFCLPPCSSSMSAGSTYCPTYGLNCNQGSGTCDAVPAGYTATYNASGCPAVPGGPSVLPPVGPDPNLDINAVADACNKDSNCQGFTWTTTASPGNSAVYTDDSTKYIQNNATTLYTKTSDAAPIVATSC